MLWLLMLMFYFVAILYIAIQCAGGIGGAGFVYA